MNTRFEGIWVYLSASPLLGLTATLAAYGAALWVHQRSRKHPLANPVLIAIAILTALLLSTGISYQTYFDGAQFVHFLLGPATVALAIPLHAHWPRLKSMAMALPVALLAGSLTAALSAWGVGKLLGASHSSLMSLAPKSVTTPIAMAIAERLGGPASLTAVLVIFTGIAGSVLALHVYRWLRIDDDAVRGFAMGIAAHGIGTARAFQISEQAGAFSALAMGFNGLLSAVLLPWVMPWVEKWLS